MQSLESSKPIEYLLLYKSNPNIAKKLIDKVDLFIQAFQMPEISLHVIQSLSFHGIPDEIKGLRSLGWRLLLGYLPKDKNKWSANLEQNLTNYESFIKEFLVYKNKENLNVQSNKPKESKSIDFISVKDHPLNKSKESDWNLLFKDLELWDEIEKDTKRTRSEISFFLDKTDPPSTYPILSHYAKKDPRFTSRTEQFHKVANDKEKPEVQHDVMTRMLFLYAKLNPGVRYVQGMNEILAPIYYCFSNDGNPFFKKYIESDSFFCFSILMGEIKDGFIRILDDSSSGIKARIQNFHETFERLEPDLCKHLENLGVHPQFYSLRWLMLLLTQEFQISDVLRLWDSLLSHPKKMEYLNFLCAAIAINSKEKLLEEEFSGVMQTLQNTDGYDLNKFLIIANKLYKENCEIEKN